MGLMIITGALFPSPAPAGEGPGEGLELWFFWGDGCDLCESAEAWLEELSVAYPELVIHSREVWHDREEQARYKSMMEERGETASWVPGFILGENAWGGFSDPIAAEIEREIEDLVNRTSEGSRLHALTTGRNLISGFWGTVDIQRQPLLAATLLIALVDGFNPCSLWTITVLLAMILHTGSRRRIAAVGGTFLLVTAMIYGLLIAGLFAALTFAAYLGPIRMLVAFLALVYAAVNIKGYFTIQECSSMDAPCSLRPSIIWGGRKIGGERSLTLTLTVTVAFAAGAAIIELPCTSGFPVIWTGLLTDAGVAGSTFLALLAAYIMVYLFLEIAIVVVALATMRVTRLQEVHGRSIRLTGGMVMAAIAIMMLIDPGGMHSISGLFYIIGGALLASALVITLRKLSLR